MKRFVALLRVGARPRVMLALGIGFYAFSLLTVNLGRPWALTYHETNYAEPAREFWMSGDWLVPRIGGTPLWDKPPLMHWSIALSLGLFQTEAEWAARVPSALFSALTALIVAGLAARRHGLAIGALAGLIQSTCVYTLIQGRLAEADMLLALAVTAAMAAFAVGVLDEHQGRSVRFWILAYFGSAGLAFLAKGPIGPALIAVGSGGFALVDRRWSTWRFLLDPFGWALMLGLIVAWPAAAALREPGLLETWWRHNVDRFTGRLGGEAKDPFFYLYTIPWMTLPWTPFAIGAWFHRRRVGGDGRFRVLLACWTGFGVALLTLSSWKHKHYIIPALPPISIWAALGLWKLLALRPPSTEPARRLWNRLGWHGAAVGGPFLAVALFGAARANALIAAAGLLGGLAAVGLYGFEALRNAGRPRAAGVALFGSIWIAFVVVQSLVLPRFDLYRGRAELVKRFSAQVPEGEPIWLVAVPDSQSFYYTRPPLKRCQGWVELVERLVLDRDGDVLAPVYLIGPNRLADCFALLGNAVVIDQDQAPHPRKSDEGRLIAIEVTPDPEPLSSLFAGTPSARRLR